MSWLDKWSNEEIAYVVSASARGTNWDRMAFNFNRKFNTTVSGNTLKKLYRVLTEKNVKQYTQSEIDFIHKCHINLMTERQTQMAYSELFGKPLNKKLWEQLLKETPSKDIQEVIVSLKKNKNKEVKNMGKRYTKKEIKQIIACKNAKEARSLGEKLGRNAKAVERQWYSLREKQTKRQDWNTKKVIIDAELLKAGLSDNNGYSKKQRQILGLDYWPPKRFDLESTIGNKISKEDAEKFVELRNAHIKNMGTRKRRTESKYLDVETVNRSIVVEPNVAKTMWTDEQDFDILCNFYELSIDEARAKFNQSYSIIAGRLEYLVDSTEPPHQMMLIEAAKVIKKRKEESAKSSKPSRRERRKARKQARLQKRIDKIKKQLRRD